VSVVVTKKVGVIKPIATPTGFETDAIVVATALPS
jgi:hypothetical protein